MIDSDKLSSQENIILESWLTVIGQIVMFWSPIERSIDQCVHFIHKDSINRKKKKPTRLNEKLRFIESFISSEDFDKETLLKIIESTKIIVKIRDVFVHGMLQSFDQEKIQIGKVNSLHDDHIIENFTIDGDLLKKAGYTLHFLSDQWHSISLILLERTTKSQT